MDKKEDYLMRGIKSAEKQRKTNEEILKEMDEVYGDEYTFDLSTYKKSSSKIKIICKKHGTDEAHYLSFLKGRGCKLCKHEKTKKYAYKSSIEDRERNAKINRKKANEKRKFEKDYILNELNKKDSSKQYKILTENGISSQIEITCVKHGNTTNFFKYMVYNKYMCKLCSNAIVSCGEKEWLDSKNITSRQITIGNYRVDGLDHERKIVYEYIGAYWHGHPYMSSKRKIFYNTRTKKSMEELFSETEKRFFILLELGIYYCLQMGYNR